MFSFGDNNQQQQNTPFFEDHEEKPSLFSSQISDQPSAFDLFNQGDSSVKFQDQSFGLNSKNMKEAIRGRQSKKSIILELDEFDKGEVFKSLEESYGKQSEEVINFFQSCGEVKQMHKEKQVTQNTLHRLAESRVELVVLQKQQHRKALRGQENVWGRIKKQQTEAEQRKNLKSEEKQAAIYKRKQQLDSKSRVGEKKKQSLLDIIKNKKNIISTQQVSSQSVKQDRKQKQQYLDQKCRQVQKVSNQDEMKALKTNVESNKSKITFTPFTFLRSSRVEFKDQDKQRLAQKLVGGALDKINENIKLKKSTACSQVQERGKYKDEIRQKQKSKQKEVEVKSKSFIEKDGHLEQLKGDLKGSKSMNQADGLMRQKINFEKKKENSESQVPKCGISPTSLHIRMEGKEKDSQDKNQKKKGQNFTNILGKKIKGLSFRKEQAHLVEVGQKKGQKVEEKQKERAELQLRLKEKPFYNLKLIKQKQKQKSELSGDQKCKKFGNLGNFRQKRQETTTLKIMKDNNLKGFTFNKQAKINNQVETREERTPRLKAEEKLKNIEKIGTEKTRRNDADDRKKQEQAKAQVEIQGQQKAKIERINWQKYQCTINELLQDINEAKKRYLQCQSNYKNIYLLLNKANYMLNEKFLANAEPSRNNRKQ